MKRIAIQGVPGSYHDIAAHKYFKNEEIELICCNTFEEVFENMRKDSNVIGVVAIENTIAGSLLHNYELLRESGATIIGEHKLRRGLEGSERGQLASGSTGSVPRVSPASSGAEGGRNG